MTKPLDDSAMVSRAEIEDFLFYEADLLDTWKLDEWLTLLTDDAAYYVPPNDRPDADHRFTLFTIADDIVRLRERVIRLKDPNCHAGISALAHTAADHQCADYRGGCMMPRGRGQFRGLPPPPRRAGAGIRRLLSLQTAPGRRRAQNCGAAGCS